MRAQSRKLLSGAAVLAAGWAGCYVDPRVDGITDGLFIHEVTDVDLVPNQTVELALQVQDDAGEPLPGAMIEIMTSDAERLRLENTGGSRVLIETEDAVQFSGTLLKGAVVVEVQVPADAPSGVVTFIASVEGQRGLTPSTRWVEFTIGACSAMGGASSEGGAGGEGGCGS